MTDATDARDATAELDERKVARRVAIGLPLVTVALATGVGVVLGLPMAILVLAAGVLLGVIAIFWASLRVLSGDAPLPPEIEALDRTGHAVDALSSRKKMLLRAIKDLENEHALGKLEDEDYKEISETYRNELKDVMKRIDASLEPFRDKAEEAARAYLVKQGVAERGDRGETPPAGDESAPSRDEVKPAPRVSRVSLENVRIKCTTCDESNEPDATFCKSCGERLDATTKVAAGPFSPEEALAMLKKKKAEDVEK
jgi:hypothetical protein